MKQLLENQSRRSEPAVFPSRERSVMKPLSLLEVGEISQSRFHFRIFQQKYRILSNYENDIFSRKSRLPNGVVERTGERVFGVARLRGVPLSPIEKSRCVH